MGARGKHVDFFTHLKTEEAFQKNVLNDPLNLWVLDVYTEWCGPCTVAENTLQQMKIKYNDEKIKFGTAMSDSITYLSSYVNKCQPTFMFMAGGQLLDVVRGVKVPNLIKATAHQLANEKKVAAGEAERAVFVDEVAGSPPAEEEIVEPEEEAPPAQRKITVAVIKPDAVAAEKVDEILAKLDEVGIDVLCNESRTLEREEAEQFYDDHRGTDFFLQLIDYMTSGAIVALALAARDPEKDVVAMWRDMIGPKDIAIAKQEAPESLRAKFAGAESGVENALHGSDSADTAARELAFFFPDYHSRMHAKTPAAIKPRLQRTLALIRPDALRKYREDIIGKINAAGFEIASAKEVSLNREQAAEFYKEHAEQEYFDKLVTHMSSGPVMALALCREDAVSGWRDMLGPKNPEEAKETAPDSLRAQFLEDCEDTGINALHGSDSLESAEREVNFFFPKQQTLAVIKPGAGDEEKEMIYSQIRSSGFHIAAQKETTLTREVAEQFYSEHKDKEFFGELTDFMTSGPTMFMVLSREDAVQGIRDMIGPSDPEEAKQSAPSSIRAKLGKDELRNAIHAASSTEKARAEIMLAFGDELKFDDDGMLIADEADEAVNAEIAGDDKTPSPQPEEPGEPEPAKPSSSPNSRPGSKGADRKGSKPTTPRSKPGTPRINSKLTNSKPGSPVKSPSKPGTPVKSTSKPGTPVETTSKPGSPVKASSKPGSPAKASSKPSSPVKSNSKPGSPAKASSKPGSPVKPNSKPGSPAKASSKPGSSVKPNSKPGSPAKASPVKGSDQAAAE